MSDSIISVKGVAKSYKTGKDSSLGVLRGVDLELRRGTIAAILGSSGSGKSTLLHILGALDRPDAGVVTLEGEELFKLSEEKRARFRNEKIGFVFQFHHLLPEFTARENVMMPALIGGKAARPSADYAKELLKRVGLDHRMEARPAQLSGGEQQRVAVARALMNNPGIVLADEPSGNLDEENAANLHDLIWNLARERGQTFVIVTHDTVLAQKADVVYRLHDGVLVTL